MMEQSSQFFTVKSLKGWINTPSGRRDFCKMEFVSGILVKVQRKISRLQCTLFKCSCRRRIRGVSTPWAGKIFRTWSKSTFSWPWKCSSWKYLNSIKFNVKIFLWKQSHPNFVKSCLSYRHGVHLGCHLVDSWIKIWKLVDWSWSIRYRCARIT